MSNKNLKKKKKKFSPMLFSTTIRNPERCKYFVKVIQKYDNQVLTDELAIKIMQDCLQAKIYYSLKAFKKIPNYKLIYNSEEEISEEMANKIVNEVIQIHKQRGFKKGWSSRFKGP